jgi:hypothetical protein
MVTEQKDNRLVDGLRELMDANKLAIGPQTRQLIKKLIHRLEKKNIENPFDIEKKQP